MQHLDLTEDETAALIRLPRKTIDADRYPLNHRVLMLKESRAKLKPQLARPAAAPEPRVYGLSRMARYRKRG